MSANPPPVHWYQSQRFIALCQSSAVLVIGWLITALSTNDFKNWKALAIAVLGNILVGLKDWFSPNVTAPFAFFNKPK